MNSNNSFTVGCNYWASNAGTYMWRNFDEAVIESDFSQLSACGIDTLRVFPLWCDFQPITRLVGTVGKAGEEIRMGDKALDETPEGDAGIDPIMIERFDRFVFLAKKHNIKLLVCLINGWMSGRMFFPPAFQNQNPITNKTAVKWEIRFVKYFVNRYKNCDSIVAWEPGNETNVLSWVEKQSPHRDEFWVWLSTIVNTIKAIDPTRPVVAGLHGLSLDGFISPRDIAEICDVMTVHPYPAFVPHCFVDGIDSMKSRLHSSAELTFYSDIGGKECLCEEIGTLGSSLGCEETVAKYLRANLRSLFANGGKGLMWWCSHDQYDLDFPPYDWCCVERELGLIRNDGTYKPAAKAMSDMRSFVDAYPQGLPERRRDAVCILSSHHDNWAVAYSSFVLSKQAGFEIRFADGDRIIPESDIYMLPCVRGDYVPKRTQTELLRRVRDEGATLYISWDEAIISDIETLTGLKVLSNKVRSSQARITFEDSGLEFELSAGRRLDTAECTGKVLAREADLNPALTMNVYGKGRIYFLFFPLERTLADKPGAFEITGKNDYYKIYEQILLPYTDRRVVSKSSPLLAVTEHTKDDNNCIVAAVNYGDDEQMFEITLADNWIPCDGEKLNFELSGGDIRLINIKRKQN